MPQQAWLKGRRSVASIQYSNPIESGWLIVSTAQKGQGLRGRAREKQKARMGRELWLLSSAAGERHRNCTVK